jgi:hypothetical protein
MMLRKSESENECDNNVTTDNEKGSVTQYPVKKVMLGNIIIGYDTSRYEYCQIQYDEPHIMLSYHYLFHRILCNVTQMLPFSLSVVTMLSHSFSFSLFHNPIV